MYSLLFAIVFQGLAVLAAVCVVVGILKLIPIIPASIYQVLQKLVSPVCFVVAIITPTAVPQALHLGIAAFWLLVLRVGLYMGAGAYGLLPLAAP